MTTEKNETKAPMTPLAFLSLVQDNASTSGFSSEVGVWVGKHSGAEKIMTAYHEYLKMYYDDLRNPKDPVVEEQAEEGEVSKALVVVQ